MFRKSIILLAFACSNNLYCMEPYYAKASKGVSDFAKASSSQSYGDKSKVPNNNSGQIQNTKDISWFKMLHEEIIVNILKSCIEASSDTKNLCMILARLQRIDKSINRLVNANPEILKFSLYTFERFKKKFFNQNKLRYKFMPHSLNGEAKTLFSKIDLHEKVNSFEKNKEKNVTAVFNRIAIAKPTLMFAIDKSLDFFWLLLCNIEDKDGSIKNKALPEVAKNGNIQALQLLINEGANINFKEDGLTPLLFASQKGYRHVTELLLVQNGIEINAQDPAGFTALMNASYYGYEEVVKLLLENGASAKVRDVHGRSALMIVLDQGNFKIARILMGAEFAKVQKLFAKYVLAQLMF